MLRVFLIAADQPFKSLFLKGFFIFGEKFLSDIVNVKVLRPKVQETTALGAAFMAGLQIGVYKSLKGISKNWHLDKRFSPKMKNKSRSTLITGWEKAVKRALIN